MDTKKNFVVLVDDNADDRFFLNQAFKSTALNLDILELADGEKAIHFMQHDCSKKTPEFILLDINMPNKDGFEVLQFLKDHPETCKSKVIVLSTSNAGSDIHKAKTMGAHEYFVKPYEYPGYLDLAEKLKQYIN